MHNVLRCPFIFIFGESVRTIVHYLPDFIVLGSEKDMHAIFPIGEIATIKEWKAVDRMTFRHVILTSHCAQKLGSLKKLRPTLIPIETHRPRGEG